MYGLQNSPYLLVIAVIRVLDDVSVHREAFLELLELVEDLGPELVVLDGGLGHGVQHLQRLVQVVESVVAVGHLELEAQLELGVGHLLEAVLDLARLDEGHNLAVERGGVARVDIQDLVADLYNKGIHINSESLKCNCYYTTLSILL